MADNTPRTFPEVIKGAEKHDDGRYILSEDEIAEIVAGICVRLRKSDDGDAMAQDAARRMAFDEMFPNNRRLVGQYGALFRKPATKATVEARAERFPNANRLSR